MDVRDLAVGSLLIPFLAIGAWGSEAGMVQNTAPLISRVQQLPRSGDMMRLRGVRLEGVVSWIDPGRSWFVFQDGSGAVEVQMNLGDLPVNAGQSVLLSGEALVGGARFGLRSGVIVENDGLHSVTERSGKIYLPKGRYPISVGWFNAQGEGILEVTCEGATLAKGLLPADRLFRREKDSKSGGDRWVPGIHFATYSGRWERIPNFEALKPMEEGTSGGLDVALAFQRQEVAMEFTGWFDAPLDGTYAFTLKSDDGSRLSFGHLALRAVENSAESWPIPRPVRLGQELAHGEDCFWSETEGTVMRMTRRTQVLDLKLNADGESAEVQIQNLPDSWLELLSQGTVHMVGVCQAVLGDKDRPAARRFLVPDGKSQLRLTKVGAECWNRRTVTPLRDLSANRGLYQDLVVRAHGRVRVAANSGETFLNDGTGEIRLAIERLGEGPGRDCVEVLGYLEERDVDPVLISLVHRRSDEAEPIGDNREQRLTQIDQVRQLPSEQVARNLPVQLRGVVTWMAPDEDSLMLQDGSGGIYLAEFTTPNGESAEVGDSFEVDGLTERGDFAPIIRCTRATRLGRGRMPDPVRPTWDQLMNGSLDSQYVELEGIVTSVNAEGFKLLMPQGVLRVRMDGYDATALRGFENGRVKVRGALAADWNPLNRQVKSGRVAMLAAGITVVEAPPKDLFVIPSKHVDELRLFNSRAGALDRIRVSGQVIGARLGEAFLMDEGQGLRCYIRNLGNLQVGDLVEAVGYTRWEGPFAVLREAIVRRIGHAVLPKARDLTPDTMLNVTNDATWVAIEGQLISQHSDLTTQTLELQSNGRRFVANLARSSGSLPTLQNGSFVRVTGVYSGRTGETVPDRDLEAFEISINKPQDVMVLRSPPWWTAGRALSLVLTLAASLVLALAWITGLRQRVEQRTRELRTEIVQHQRTEEQLEAEIAERKRVELEMEKTHKHLVLASREAGMAEVASSVLHSVGNVLNSVNVSANLIVEHVRRSRVGNITRAAALLQENQTQLGSFLTDDPRGKQLPQYLAELGQHLIVEQASLLTELQALDKSVEHIKQVVAMQQNYAKLSGAQENVHPKELIEDAIRMHSNALERTRIALVREYESGVPELLVDRHQVLQILGNLIQNAIRACDDGAGDNPRLNVRLARVDDTIQFQVADNGVGIPSENLTRIFNFAFATRKSGHGYGLHSSALAAKALGGSLDAASDGLNCGATFTLKLPRTPRIDLVSAVDGLAHART